MRVAVPSDTEAIVVKWCWDLRDTILEAECYRKNIKDPGIGRASGIQSMAKIRKHGAVRGWQQ